MIRTHQVLVVAVVVVAPPPPPAPVVVTPTALPGAAVATLALCFFFNLFFFFLLPLIAVRSVIGPTHKHSTPCDYLTVYPTHNACVNHPFMYAVGTRCHFSRVSFRERIFRLFMRSHVIVARRMMQ